MMHFDYYSKVDKFAYKLDMKRRLEKANGRLKKQAKIGLTAEEKKMFQKAWGDWSMESCEFYKAYCGRFDVGFVPNDYYDFAEHVLNLRWAAFFLQHKCNLKYIIPVRNRPTTVLQKIDGHYVYEDNSEISIAEAKALLKQKDSFICKVAFGSGGGKGVRKVCLSKEEDVDATLARLMKPEDLIFQDVICQSDFMSSFNPDSVNTIRLLTLNLNGNCSVLSSFMRMGARGSFVDNLCSGGGVLVGINQSGEINEFGIRKDYSKAFEASSGILFKGLTVPNWDEVKESVIRFHQRIPYANLIGWDIAIDKDGESIVIEINLDNAEIEAHQVFNGPVFGERLEEVREYIDAKKPLLRHAMITY